MPPLKPLGVALGLHLLLLALPVQEPPSTLIPADEPDVSEVEAVSIVALENLLGSADSQPASNNPAAAPLPEATPAPPPPPAAAAPTAPPALVEAPELVPPVSDLGAQPNTPEPDPPAEPEAQLQGAGDLQTWLMALQPGGAIASATPDAFTHPEFFYKQDSTGALSSQLKPEILRTAILQGQSPNQVFISMLASAQDRGFRISQRPDYGNGLVYEVSQNNQTWYFNLVTTSNQQGTVIVVWSQSPPQ